MISKGERQISRKRNKRGKKGRCEGRNMSRVKEKWEGRRRVENVQAKAKCR